MLQARMLFRSGMVGSLAIVLSGCVGGSAIHDAREQRLEEAVAAAQAALEMELPGIPGNVERVDEFNGIPVVQYHAPEDAVAPFTGAYGYGGWLGERGFAVYSAPAVGIVGRTYLLANDDDMSGGAPDAAGGSATWNGVMLGVDTTEMDDAGVRGSARLDLDMSAATVDVEFSGVTGIANDRTYDGHRWTGVSFTGSSFDGNSGHGGTIDGQFYGEHHEDVIGEFEYDNLKGAWGAVRTTSRDGGMGEDDMGGDDMSS